MTQTSGINSMLGKLELHSDAMASVESFDFDCLKLSDMLGRENTFSMVVFKIMNDLPMQDSGIAINSDKLISFLQTI